MKIENFDLEKDVLVIAELSANHAGSLELAKKSIKAIAQTGADMVKFQTYRADTITLDCNNKYFQIQQSTPWDGRSLYELYQEAFTPWEWHAELFAYARSLGLMVMSSPFDKSAVDFLEDLTVPAYKIASFEITDIPLIRYAASKQKPMIISTGIADEEDIALALNACKSVGNDKVILLKCTSSYPAKVSEMNLQTITEFQKRFGVSVGLSDHSLGDTAAICAVGLGARVVEKHFILDKSINSVDASFSLDTSEFTQLCQKLKEANSALGQSSFSYNKSNRKFARSLFVAKAIKKGEVFTKEHVRSVRPSDGLHPKYYEEVLGKEATCDIAFGEPLLKEYVQGLV